MKSLLVINFLCLATLASFGQGVMQEELKLEQLQALIDAADMNSLDEHCEVPCGIYGDSLRVSLMKEHSKTVEKAMSQINKLGSESTMNLNQIVRWVNNKEKHAEEIQHIVSQYFLHQRVKFVKSDLSKAKKAEAEAKYYNQLESLHRILVYAMKCKQTTNEVNVANMNAAIEDFSAYYFHGHKH